VNSFTYGNWAINANEIQNLYFQIVDLDQFPWETYSDVSWPGVIQQQSVIPNSLRYLTGQGVGNTPVIVTVQFPSLNCQVEPLTVIATAVSASDASLFVVSLTPLQTPGSGNIIFTVQEGLNIRRFVIQNGIVVTNVYSQGQC
jgi:hypothetical protein